ncbi:MAG: hypothetical protein U0517_00460 [Candidatus Andersenbacteria bacterium]
MNRKRYKPPKRGITSIFESAGSAGSVLMEYPELEVDWGARRLAELHRIRRRVTSSQLIAELVAITKLFGDFSSAEMYKDRHRQLADIFSQLHTAKLDRAQVLQLAQLINVPLFDGIRSIFRGRREVGALLGLLRENPHAVAEGELFQRERSLRMRSRGKDRSANRTISVEIREVHRTLEAMS